MTERVDLGGVDGQLQRPLRQSLMQHDDLTTPFDVEADEASDLTQEFWGTSRGWVSEEQPEIRPDDHAGSMQAVRDGLRAFRPRRRETTDRINRVGRTRQHGVLGRNSVHMASPEATLSELATDGADDRAADGWDHNSDTDLVTEPTERHVAVSPVEPLADRLGVGAVDPLLVRLGIVILIGALLVPLALTLRPGSADGALQTTPVAGPSAADAASPESDAGALQTTPVAETAAPESAAAAAPAPGVEASDGEPAVSAGVTDVAVDPTPGVDSEPASESATQVQDVEDADADLGDAPQGRSTSASEVATVAAPADRVVPECPQTYEVGAGDSWYGIAAAADVTPSALLRENTATTDTVILPGDEICLPSGATVPAKPVTTQAPATTDAPATTAAPTTTTAPSTTAPASRDSVQQIIRDVWPDELEEKALAVAFRESSYSATAYNGWCCYGVFQLYWTVHRSWLDDYGIYSSDDLFDARKNITAAYALYQRSGGWGPWGG